MGRAGTGKAAGEQVGDHFYDELAKCMFMVVVEDEQVEVVTNSTQAAASTGFPCDGRVFVTNVESAFTLRTGESGL